MAAIACYYKVTLDTCPVNDWTQVDGIGITLEHEQREDGGNPFMQRLLSKGLKYTDITLTRPVDGASVGLVTWVCSFTTGLTPGGGSIDLVTSEGESLHSWTIMKAVPVSYKGPALGIDKNQVATESIVIKHEGFLEAMLMGMAGSLLSMI